MRRSLAVAVTTAAMALAVAPVGAAHAEDHDSGSDSGATPTGKILGETSKSAVEGATPKLPTDGLVTSNVPVLN